MGAKSNPDKDGGKINPDKTIWGQNQIRTRIRTMMGAKSNLDKHGGKINPDKTIWGQNQHRQDIGGKIKSGQGSGQGWGQNQPGQDYMGAKSNPDKEADRGQILVRKPRF